MPSSCGGSRLVRTRRAQRGAVDPGSPCSGRSRMPETMGQALSSSDLSSPWRELRRWRSSGMSRRLVRSSSRSGNRRSPMTRRSRCDRVPCRANRARVVLQGAVLQTYRGDHILRTSRGQRPTLRTKCRDDRTIAPVPVQAASSNREPDRHDDAGESRLQRR